MRCLIFVLLLTQFGNYGANAEVVIPKTRDTPGPSGAPRTQKPILFQPDFDQKTKARLDGEVYVIINHAEEAFDPQGQLTKLKVRELVQSSQKQGLPIIGAINVTNEEQFFTPDEVSTVVTTYSGAHKIQFANAKTLAFAGGNFQYCLCESIRDSLKFRISQAPLRIVLLTDAIYDLPKSPEDPEFDRSKPVQLAQYLKTLSQQEMPKYLRETLVANGNLCGKYKFGDGTSLSAQKFKFSLINYDGKEFQSLGEPFGNGNQKVDVVLTEVRNFERLMERDRATRSPSEKKLAK